MHFLASAIFMQAALNFQRQFLCLRHSRNVDFEDNTRKAHVCTHSPLATLPVSLLFECRVSQPWSFSFTISWECFISNVTSTLAFSGTSLTLLFACFLIHSKSCPDLYTRSQDPLSSAFHPSRDTWLPWDLHTPIRIQQREGGREGGGCIQVENQLLRSWKWAIRQELENDLTLSVPDDFCLLALLIISVQCHPAVSDSTSVGPCLKI